MAVQPQIHPHRVTKPIQLLAAWLVGLLLTNATFLGTAVSLQDGSWQHSALILASIANVPLFLVAIFVLQTRFRAELQEDSFYSEYLNKKTAEVVRVDRIGLLEGRIRTLEGHLPEHSAQRSPTSEGEASNLDWSSWRIGLNARLPNFQEVRHSLKSARIPVHEVFGTAPDSERPSKLIVSIDRQLPTKHKAQLLTALAPLGFDGFQLWNPDREAGETEDVYIGSYGGGNYATFGDAIQQLLSTEFDEIDLDQYVREHAVQYVED